MKLVAAQLQEQSAEDRMLVTDQAAVVLDGATTHDPRLPSAGPYVDTLLDELRRRLRSEFDLQTILRAAISATAARLDLQPGRAPSSTVAICRDSGPMIEILVLGDSPVIVGHRSGDQDIITDQRLVSLNLPESNEYRERLESGSGYDEMHQQILEALQRKQRDRRNRSDGYWIAEAEPSAADHAILTSYPADAVEWIVITTDGVLKYIAALHLLWHDVARLNAEELSHLLTRSHEWEARQDPHGQLYPRSKRHDDKTVVIAKPDHG